MKKAAVIISLLLSVVMLIMIIGLREEVDTLSSQIQNAQNNIKNRINELESFIEHSKEEEASILSSYDWEYVNEDMQNRKVAVKVNVTPKEYSTTTEAFFVCNGTEYPMTLENGTFTGSIVASFADKIKVSQFIFKDGDSVRTEAVEFDASPKYDYLPDIYPEFVGSYGGKLSSTTPEFLLEGDMLAHVSSKTDAFEMGKVELAICVNDKEVKRVAMTKVTDTEDNELNDNVYRVTIDEELNVNVGDTVETYIEATDSFNWKYRALAFGVTVMNDGDMMEEMTVGVTEIYDENGKLLFDDSELYQ